MARGGDSGRLRCPAGVARHQRRQGRCGPVWSERCHGREIAGVEPATITFDKSNGSLHAEVSGAVSMSADQLVGMDGEGPAVIANAPFGAVTQPFRQATSKGVSY